MTPNTPLTNRPNPVRNSSRPQVIQGAFPGRRPLVVQASGHGDSFQLPPTFNLGRGGGQPLPEPVQQKMEAFFGTSFSDVRIHVGPEASSIGALAFTHGSNIFFAPGLYNPGTPQGQQLLGHELTHVVQQRAGRVRNPFGSGVAVVQDPNMEAEAERMGLRAAMSVLHVQPKMADGARPTPRLTGDDRPAHVQAAMARRSF
jgi:hypothetical protein